MKCIEDIKMRGKVPIVVGNSIPYLETLLYDTKVTDNSSENHMKQTNQQVNVLH
jgi:tRNA A37 N6-isopentenylltransferase MiaA